MYLADYLYINVFITKISQNQKNIIFAAEKQRIDTVSRSIDGFEEYMVQSNTVQSGGIKEKWQSGRMRRS